ncbi:MAG: type II toxin-antitoxin system Phd/YefM family antitoxin [Leadbetterella sp.]
MQVLNYSEFRSNMKAALDSVTEDSETVIINRGNENNAVLISLKEYNALLETIHLSSSTNNNERLLAAIERDKQTIFEKHDIIQ